MSIEVVDKTVAVTVEPYDPNTVDVDDDDPFFEDWSCEDDDIDALEVQKMTDAEVEEYLLEHGIDTDGWYDRLRDTILEKTGVFLPMARPKAPKGKA